MRFPAVVALIALVTAAGACAGRGGAPTDGPLASSLHAESFSDSVRFSLQVTNASTAPVRLTFSSAQLFDFLVSQDGREVWRWSADRAFAQALHELILAPGETRAFDAVWHRDAGTRGELQVRAVLAGEPYRVEQQTRFHLN
jgi:hypothetical protein